jgi:hypothetical protein
MGELESLDVRGLDVYTVLSFLNGPECTVETLTQEIGVRATAATNIVAHVRGRDGRLGTRDDNPFDSIEELDAVPQVGPATIKAIDAYLAARNAPNDLVIEGVSLSTSLAVQIVALCNTASHAVLDDDVGLDTRAATAIVAARPLADIQAVAAASYVGSSAIARLRDYVLAHPQVEPAPISVRNPARISSAVARDSTHVVVTFNRAIDPATRASAFSIFIGEPDAGGLSLSLVSVQGAVVTLETEAQEPGLDYTIEATETLRDDAGQLMDPHGRWAHFDGFAGAPTSPTPPTPAVVDCAALRGGSFDGIAYSATEECQAVQFLNRARYSEMGALVDAGRRVAYDCAPNGSCGFRTSAWTRLSEFSGFVGVGATSLSSLKTAMRGWSANGSPYDTVAHLWQQRAALLDQPINLDNVHVTRRLPDQTSDSSQYSCVELRDQVGAPNFIAACMRLVNADSASGCSGYPPSCLDPAVGTRVSLRGTWRAAAQSPGGYRLLLNATGPGAPNPSAL